MDFTNIPVTTIPLPILLLLLVWTLPWKGLALWRAARSHDRVWFVVLLVVQTVGILEIVYLFFIRPHVPPHDDSDTARDA
jgi:methionyl-tRNA synthetase